MTISITTTYDIFSWVIVQAVLLVIVLRISMGYLTSSAIGYLTTYFYGYLTSDANFLRE